MSKNDQLDWGHPVVEQAITLPGVQRRRLIQLAVTVLVLAPGCALLNPQTEFESAVDDLSQELKADADNEAQDAQLQSLAEVLHAGAEPGAPDAALAPVAGRRQRGPGSGSVGQA